MGREEVVERHFDDATLAVDLRMISLKLFQLAADILAQVRHFFVIFALRHASIVEEIIYLSTSIDRLTLDCI